MFEYLLERGLYAAMAAVLIVPEPATFLVLLGFLVIVAALCGRFGWNLAISMLREDRPESESAALPA
jgi:PEP-CTERM motif